MLSRSIARTPLVCLFAGLCGVGCSGLSPEAPSLRTEEAIINGTPGGPPQVGRLLWKDGNGSWFFCSGTLVSPDLVLSARHCLYDLSNDRKPFAEEGDWIFQLYDAEQGMFVDDTEIGETFVPPIVASDNFAEWPPPLGTPDVALFRLATPITRLAPLSISFEPVNPSKPQFTAAGVGFSSHDEDTSTPEPVEGLMSTELVLTALMGQYYHVPFPTFGAFVDAIAEEEDVDAAQFSDDDMADFQAWYDGPLAEGFEGYFLGKTDGQPCHGDSGGPLLQQDGAGKPRIFGTVSGSLSFDESHQCELGEIYSLFNQPVQDFFTSHGLAGTPTNGGSGGSAGMSSGGSAGASSGGAVASTGGSATGGTNFAGSSTSGKGGATAGGSGGASGSVSSVAGRAAGMADSDAASDTSGCSVAYPTRGSSTLGMFAALVGVVLGRCRRRRA